MEAQESVMPVVHSPEQTNGSNGMALFSHDPEVAFQEAQRIVNVVARRCTGPGYLVNIKGKQYPKIEWWTTISASLGLFPKTVFAKRMDREGEVAYEARVEVHRNGVVISSGEAMCSDREDRWSKADEYAIKSMAITRASGKAYRIPLSFLAVMAGLEATPAEEIPREVTAFVQENANRATARQLASLAELAKDRRLTDDEKVRIQGLLLDGMTKAKASEVLQYFHGESRYRDGVWVRTTEGALANR